MMNLVRWPPDSFTQSTRENPVMSSVIFKQANSHRSALVFVGIHNGAWSRQSQLPKGSPRKACAASIAVIFTELQQQSLLRAHPVSFFHPGAQL